MQRKLIRKRHLLAASAMANVLMWTADRGICQATSLSWSNISGGDWGNSANWNPQQTPTSADDTTFSLGATSPYPVTLSANETANSITLSNDQVSINPEGNTLSVGTVSLSFTGGQTPASTLDLAGSGTINLSGPMDVGNGTVNQSGDYVSATGLSVNPIFSTATYLLSSGTLVTGGGGEGIGNANIFGQFTQTGGTNQFNQMSIGGVVGGGAYSIQGGSASGGTINLGGNSTLNIQGIGTLNLGGGSLLLSGAIVASSNGNSTVNLSAGTLEVGSMNFAGTTTAGYANFNWTGGTLILHGSLSVGPTGQVTQLPTQAFAIPTKLTLISVGGGIRNALNINSGGTLEIGNGSPSTFHLDYMGSGAMSAGSNLVLQIDGTTAGTGYSQLQGQSATNFGTFTLGGNLIFDLGYAAAVGDQFTIVDDLGNNSQAKFFNGAFAGLAPGTIFNEVYGGQTYGFQIAYNGGAAGDNVVVTTISAPEPGTLGLLSLVACSITMRRRRRFKVLVDRSCA
jgi:fibronectin-binding autotransporter adhesin